MVGPLASAIATPPTQGALDQAALDQAALDQAALDQAARPGPVAGDLVHRWLMLLSDRTRA